MLYGAVCQCGPTTGCCGSHARAAAEQPGLGSILGESVRCSYHFPECVEDNINLSHEVMCSVHHAACIIQRATCNMHRATCDAQRATCNTGLPIDLRRYGALMLRHQTVEHNMCVGPLRSTPEYRHTVYVVFACMYSSVHGPACGVGSSALSVPCIRPAVGMPLRVQRSGHDFDGIQVPLAAALDNCANRNYACTSAASRPMFAAAHAVLLLVVALA